MSINELNNEGEEEELPIGFRAISQAQALFMAARVAAAQQALSGKQPLGAVTLGALAHLNKKAERESVPVSSIISEAVSRGLDEQKKRNQETKTPREVNKTMDALARSGALGRFSQLDQISRDKAGDAVAEAENVDPIIGFCQRAGIPTEKLFDFLIREAEAKRPTTEAITRPAVPEAKKLHRDRQRYEKTGKVTNRLLQNMWGKSRSTVSYRLNALCNAGAINTALADKLTANEVQFVIKDVSENPFREKT